MTKVDRAALSVFEAPDPEAADSAPPGSADLLAAAEAIHVDVVAIRRRIHRWPEIGLDLPKTQAVVLEELTKLGIEGRKGAALSSVVGGRHRRPAGPDHPPPGRHGCPPAPRGHRA